MPGRGGRQWTGILQRARSILREQGFRVLVWKALGETVFRRMRYFERALAEPIPQIVPRSRVLLEELGGHQLQEYLLFRPEASAREVSARLRAGNRCFVARSQGRIVHARWAIITGRPRCEVLGVELPIAGDCAYVCESLTLPEMRGLGIAAAVDAFMLRRLRESGLRAATLVVDPDNRAGIRTAAKTGYRAAGWVAVIRLGPWRRLIRWSGVREPEPAYWNNIGVKLLPGNTYLDPFLARLKRRIHLRLIRRWTQGMPPGARILKTDLFEEANGRDALIPGLAGGGRRVFGVDISPAITARSAGSVPDSTRLAAADVRALPFADGVFDLVISPSTLDHFRDPADLGRSLQEIRRALHPEGRLIITLDNRQNVLDWLLRAASRLRLTPYYLGRSYTIDELRRELAAAGFSVLDATGIVQTPRLMAMTAAAVARWVNWRLLTRFIHRNILRAQRFEQTPWKYWTACFVCACAAPGRDRTPHGRETWDSCSMTVESGGVPLSRWSR